jgi:PAS domain S-box-containing protein
MQQIRESTDLDPATLDEPVRIVCVDDDPEFLEFLRSRLADHEEFEVSTATEPDAVLDRLAEVDCVVSDYEMPGRNGVEFLTAVRQRRPSLPFILFTGSRRGNLPESFPESVWTEVLAKGNPDEVVPLLATRICRLVSHGRTAAVARRALAAIETVGEGLAVVGPDGSFSFVNGAFARQFGYEPDDLLGRSWKVCYPDDEAQRLESTALETVRDDWQWTGGCVGRDADGDTVTVQTRIAGLDDGSFVFSLPGDES